MDIFKFRDWLMRNKKMILRFSHIAMAITLINSIIALFDESFGLYLSYFIWSFILQLVLFITIQIMFNGNE
jgi:hypothetical protein